MTMEWGRSAALGAALAVLWPVAAGAASRDPVFWNLTGNTVTALQLARPGSTTWGRNLTAGDDDGTVDHDERLPLRGIKPGRYDLRFSDDLGRTCTLRGITIAAGKVFEVHDRNVKDCTEKGTTEPK